MPSRIPWGWIIPLVLIVALAFTARAYAGAMGQADAAAAEGVRLDSVLRLVEADTVRLSRALFDSDTARVAQLQRDSVRLADLDRENDRISSAFDSLVVADQSNAENVEAALSALEADLDARHLPALRRVTGAYETRLLGFRSQVSVQQARIGVLTEQRDIARADAERERGSRSAADALAVGLRNQIVQQVAIIDTKDREIGSLRNAVAPGFFTRLKQEAQIVSVTAAVASVLTFVLTR